jgi:Ino eighty subunit 2
MAVQIETINKLLKKQAPKQRRTRLVEGEGDGTPNNQETEPEKANPVFVRWISNRQGSVLAVPQEWLGTPLGQIFDGGPRHNPTAEPTLTEA